MIPQYSAGLRIKDVRIASSEEEALSRRVAFRVPDESHLEEVPLRQDETQDWAAARWIGVDQLCQLMSVPLVDYIRQIDHLTAGILMYRSADCQNTYRRPLPLRSELTCGF